jgi:hypothetical protein
MTAAKPSAIAALVFGLGFPLTASAESLPFDGEVSIAATAFPRSPRLDEQAETATGTLALNIEDTVTITDSVQAAFDTRFNVNANKDDVVFADAREAQLAYETRNAAVQVGMLDMPWGFLNAENLVNVVNARDLVADYQGDVRLGQPGARVEYFGQSWSLSGFGSPLARKTRLNEGRDRYRVTDLPLANADFEDGQVSPQLGARLYWRRDRFELALSQYTGHNDEPEFRPILGRRGVVELEPRYRRIYQSGIASQYATGPYVLRGEVIYRRGQSGDAFLAGGLGIERTFIRAIANQGDIVTYVEGYLDGRPDRAPTESFDNDIAIGANFRFRDLRGTVLDTRLVYDWRRDSALVDIAFNRRIGSTFRVEASASVPLMAGNDPALRPLRRDQSVMVSLSRFF